MTSKFLATLACGAPGPVQERALDEAARAHGFPAVAAAARRAGLAAAFGRFLADGPDFGSEARRAVAAGLLAEARTRACLELLHDLGAACGAEALAIKGGALLVGEVCGTERQVVDVDLLVADRDLAAWTDAAERVGAALEPCREAHEMGYVRRGNALVELHRGLPAAVGKESGPGFDAVRAVASPGSARYPGVRPVLGRAAREISVHHFVFHHGGDPVHAFRALQDLSRLRDEGAGLDWGAHPPGAALARLDEVVASVRAGEFGGNVAEFLRRFAKVQDLQTSTETEFADVIDRWLALRKSAGEGRLGFVLGRAFPPALPLGERLKRPFSLAARYAAGAARRSRPAAREIEGWRRFLEGI